MAYYVKCNEKTYQYIGAPAERVALPDGNHIAWQADFAKFQQYPDFRAIAAATGSLLLSPSEARDEQDGVTCRELPEATDEMFRMEPVAPDNPEGPEAPEPPVESDPSDVSDPSDSSDSPTTEEGGKQ